MTIDDLIKKYTEGCFLEIEEFDLKKYYLKVMAEDREIKNNAIKRWLRYEKTNTVDLDGCGKGSSVSIFSREVYECLWEFKAKHLYRDKYYYDHYGCSLFDKEIHMGPETMNTVIIPLRTYLKNHTTIWNDNKGKNCIPKNQRLITANYLEKIRINIGDTWQDAYLDDLKEIWNEYVMLSGTIGNLTLVPAYFNPTRGSSYYLKDYWDLSLDYLKNNGFRKVNYPKDLKSMSKENFKVYINTFFLWDYVKANDDEYIVRSLCEGKLENHISFDKAEDDVERFKTFLENVCGCIRRRSLFMTAMLWLKDCHRDLYEDLIRKISDDRVMSGYDLVFKCLLGEDSSIEVDKKLVDKLTDGDRELLRGTWRRINEIKVYQ